MRLLVAGDFFTGQGKALHVGDAVQPEDPGPDELSQKGGEETRGRPGGDDHVELDQVALR